MEARPGRIMAWAALTIVLVEDVIYVVLISGQPDRPPDAYTAPFVASYLLLVAALLGASLLRRPRVVAARTPLRAAAAGGLLVLGILAAFSIGVPLVLAGILATGASVRTLKGPVWALSGIVAGAAAVLAVAVLIAGFEVTERLIVCPASGNMSGGGNGFVTGSFHYECVEGRLSFHSG